MKRALVLVVLLACAKSNKLPPEAWGSDDYVKAGLDISKPWAAADYDNALTVLRQVSTDHRDRLPRYKGPKSGQVFAKLSADLPDDAAKPIAERFGEHAQHYGAVNEISKLYMPSSMAVPTREWIELIGAVMRESTMLASNSDAFMATIPADDPSRETRLNGLAKMKAGYGMMMHGGLFILGDLRVSETDRLALATHIKTAMPVLFPNAPGETQAKLRELLSRLTERLPSGELRDTIAAIQQALPPA